MKWQGMLSILRKIFFAINNADLLNEKSRTNRLKAKTQQLKDGNFY